MRGPVGDWCTRGINLCAARHKCILLINTGMCIICIVFASEAGRKGKLIVLVRFGGPLPRVSCQPSLFAYWLWSCVVTVLILLTKYWHPRDVTLLNYFLKPRGITSACWKCSTDGRSISLAATIRPPPPTQSPTPEVDHIIPQCQEYVYFKNAGGSFCSSMAFRLFVHDLSKLVQKWSDLWWKWQK